MVTTQKKVSFNTTVSRRFIERAPSAERCHLWYRRSDYSEARGRERFIQTCLQQCDHSELVDNLISEGIFTIEQTLIKNITVDNAISAVLDEQERQEADYDHHYYDNDVSFVLNDKEIALEYRVHSRVSLAQAQNRARRHAEHMRQVLSPPPPHHQRSPDRSSTSLTKSKMSLVHHQRQYTREVLRREDAPQVVKCTTPAA